MIRVGGRSFFFFSSRRRHTRWPRDWSSDVCSSDLALAHPDRTTTAELAATVLAEDLRLQRLAEDLLLLTKADEHSLALRRRPVDLDDLVFEEAGRLRDATRLRVATAAVSAARVEGDAAALARVLRNLADNAARHAGGR